MEHENPSPVLEHTLQYAPIPLHLYCIVVFGFVSKRRIPIACREQRCDWGKLTRFLFTFTLYRHDPVSLAGMIRMTNALDVHLVFSGRSHLAIRIPGASPGMLLLTGRHKVYTKIGGIILSLLEYISDLYAGGQSSAWKETIKLSAVIWLTKLWLCGGQDALLSTSIRTHRNMIRLSIPLPRQWVDHTLPVVSHPTI